MPVYPAAKIMAIIPFVLTAIPAILFGIYDYIWGEGGLLFMLGLPFVYLVTSFIITAIYCWLYNWLAPKVGGMQIELEDTL